MAGIYIHVPFCIRKCAYCSFISYPNHEDTWNRYIDKVVTELESEKEHLQTEPVKSVYFGGGTPSLMSVESFDRVLTAIENHYELCADAEISMEMNPATSTEKKLRQLRRRGVNRLSIGVQSFDPALLHTLGRIHDAEQAIDAVKMARDAGFENINIDLMYALPGQSLAQWTDTLGVALELHLEHISAYSLIVEEGTPIATRVERGEIFLPQEDVVNEMQRAATRLLSENGLLRYEISNYSRPGFESVHNRGYWTRDPYLGVGCAAHSLIGNTRFSNPEGLEEYLNMKLPAQRCENKLSREEQIEEHLLLETRMVRGLDLEELMHRFDYDLLKTKKETIHRLEEEGLVCVKNHYLCLTEKGMELQNAIVLALVD